MPFYKQMYISLNITLRHLKLVMFQLLQNLLQTFFIFLILNKNKVIWGNFIVINLVHKCHYM